MGVITVGSFNLEHDGFTKNPRGGGDVEKWYAAHEQLSQYPFDVLFRQEMTHSRANGNRLLLEAERLMRLRGFIAPHSSPESPNPPGVFVNPEKFRPIGEWPQSTGWWHAPAAITVKYKEAPTTIQLASVHLCSRSPEIRQAEARIMTTWQSTNQVALIGGDFNSYSASGRELDAFPDWPILSDRGHQERRTRLGTHTDTEPDRILTAVGLDDVALHAAGPLGQADALAPTASMYTETNMRQGPPQRIDRQYASRVLLGALESFRVVPLPAVSDHALTISVWDEDDFLSALHQQPGFDYRLPASA